MRQVLLVGLLLTVACGRSASSWNRKGADLAEAGRYEEAIRAFGRAAELDPRMAKAHYNMGLAYMRLRQPDQAATCLRKALEIDPSYVEASRALSRVAQALDVRGRP